MKLLFKNFKLIQKKDLLKLDSIYQNQLLVVVRAFWGKTTPIKKVLDETYEGNIEFWQVVDAKEPDKILYDVWVANADTAAVFYSGTTTNTTVGMIQFYFDTLDITTPELEALAKNLQIAFNDRPDVYDLDANSPQAAYLKAVREIQKNTDSEDED
jgi:hypothetical protein